LMRRRRILIRHDVCHGLWRMNRIYSRIASCPKLQVRFQRRWSNDCHERVSVPSLACAVQVGRTRRTWNQMG
jgi:hypothetical protein